MPKATKYSLRSKRSLKSRRQATVDPRRLSDIKSLKSGGMRICPKCGSIYYDKKWYAPEELARHLAKRAELKEVNFAKWLTKAKQVARETLCAADRQGKDNSEGVVILKGLRPGLKEQVMRLVKNIDREGRKNDVEDKILSIEDHGEEVTIYTSENQLAHRMGNQIASAFKKGKLQIKFSDREDATRVYWQAPESSS